LNDGDVATELAALAASMTRLAERVGIPEAPPCEPGKHDVPPAAQPGTVTKCRRCRKSVRVPKAKPGEPEPDQRIAELEKRVAERERQMTRLAERARLRMAELEAQLGQAGGLCGVRLRYQDLPGLDRLPDQSRAVTAA
jgi:hypothetical protein